MQGETFCFHHDLSFTVFFPHLTSFLSLCATHWDCSHILHTKAHGCNAADAYDHTTLSTPVLV